MKTKSIEIGVNKLSIEDISSISKGHHVHLSSDPDFRKGIAKSRNFLDESISAGKRIYGVNTGFGDSCTNQIDKELLAQLPINITRYHQCGLGDYFSSEETRAIQAVRLASLVKPYSACSIELLEHLSTLINVGISPRIPKEGSVGASGDLTPLAYLGSTIIGEGECLFKGELVESKYAYSQLSMAPYQLKPKEGLALMNGTAVMTALACLAFKRAEKIADLACIATAMNVIGVKGNPDHYERELFEAKPHPGQMQAAESIAQSLSSYKPNVESMRLQDRYSLRCAPHIIGVLKDILPIFRNFIEVEINSANDNPLVLADREKVLHGGNFYGGHIAFAMDSMKTLVANIADLLDRQMALLVDTKFNNGLPANLSGMEGNSAGIHHGYKALQISASAWTAEALKLCMPASVFSRSTECHNQDKVSMGTIAARDCLRIIELTEQVLTANIFCGTQAIYLRDRSKEISREQWSEKITYLYEETRKITNPLQEDRPLETDLRRFLKSIENLEVS